MQQILLDYKLGDVNGDGIPDRVYLTGNRTPESSFIQDITLVVEDGVNKIYQKYITVTVSS